MMLRDKDRNTLLTIFAAVDMPMEVWAYGSRVSGEAHEGSDLDLVIRTQTLVEITLPEDNDSIFARRYQTVLPDKQAFIELLNEEGI